MTIYLAARYARRAEMREVARRLGGAGHIVTARWIVGHEDEGGEYLLGGTNRPLYAQFAAEDLEDIRRAGIVVSFTEEPRKSSSRGGRHVEFGYALAWNKRQIVVGPLENVFHCLPNVTVVADVPGLIEVLTAWDEEVAR